MLWIGCVDSCVLVEIIIYFNLGDLFVYCNIVNFVCLVDDNIMSVLEYVVCVFKVVYVIVCGYDGCGGVCVLLLLLFDGLLYVVCCIVLLCVLVGYYCVEFDGVFDLDVCVNCLVEFNVFE